MKFTSALRQGGILYTNKSGRTYVSDVNQLSNSEKLQGKEKVSDNRGYNILKCFKISV